MFDLVVPPRPARGALAAPTLFGVLTGAGLGLLDGFGMFPDAMWLQVVLYVGPFLLAVVSAALLARVWLSAPIASLSFVAAEYLSSTATQSLCDPNGVVVAETLAHWGMWTVLAGVIVVVPTVVLGAGVYWVRSRALYAIVVQDGSRCWRCGYRPGSDVIVVCPECGTTLGSGQRLPRVFTALGAIRRWARPALTAVLLLGAVIIVVRAAEPRSRRLAEFYHRFPHPLNGRIDGGLWPIECAGAWVGFNRGQGPGLWISYLPEDKPGVPAMLIRLGTQTKSGKDVAVLPLYPATDCALDRAQAQWIIAHGMPDSLLRAFREQPVGGSRLASHVHLPAAPHFRGLNAQENR